MLTVARRKCPERSTVIFDKKPLGASLLKSGVRIEPRGSRRHARIQGRVTGPETSRPLPRLGSRVRIPFARSKILHKYKQLAAKPLGQSLLADLRGSRGEASGKQAAGNCARSVLKTAPDRNHPMLRRRHPRLLMRATVFCERPLTDSLGTLRHFPTPRTTGKCLAPASGNDSFSRRSV